MERALEQVKKRAKRLVERVQAGIPPLTPELKQKLVCLDMFPKVPIAATAKRPSTGICLFLSLSIFLKTNLSSQ